ncbi:hypothetical protein Q3G72_010276 [Acer saccharum]|nr:hypothetical protein Q3G72_010276 [Acer saccharum]
MLANNCFLNAFNEKSLTAINHKIELYKLILRDDDEEYEDQSKGDGADEEEDDEENDEEDEEEPKRKTMRTNYMFPWPTLVRESQFSFSCLYALIM